MEKESYEDIMKRLESETADKKPAKGQQPVSTEKKWYAPLIIVGLIIGSGTPFAKTLIGGEIVLIFVAIGAGFLYYPLKSKIRIKNEIVKVVITFLILEIIAGMSVGFVGGLINGLISKSGNQQRIAECKGICDYIPATKVWKYNSISDAGRTVAENSPEKYGAKIVFSPSKYFPTQEQCIDYCLTQ